MIRATDVGALLVVGLVAFPALPAAAIAAVSGGPAAGMQRAPLAPFRSALAGKGRIDGQRVRFRAGLGLGGDGYRIDLFHPVTRETLLSLGIMAGRLVAVWPGSHECLEASADAALLDRLLGVPARPEHLPALIAGRVFADPGVIIRSVTATRRHLEVVAADSETGAVYRAKLDRRRPERALGGVREGADGMNLEVSYGRWRWTKPSTGNSPRTAYPSRVRLRVPGNRLALTIRVTDRAGGGPPAAALLPPRPPGCRAVLPEELVGRREWGAGPTP